MNIYTKEELERKSDLTLNTICSKITSNWNSPCNNWSDCGELIDDCGMTVKSKYGFASAINSRNVIKYCKQESIKRAVTIVYILIKQCQK